jgi:hypothetical protein
MSESRVDFVQPFQRFPSGHFADRDVWIVRHNRFAVCGIRDADGKPRADQSI